MYYKSVAFVYEHIRAPILKNINLKEIFKGKFLKLFFVNVIQRIMLIIQYPFVANDNFFFH